MPKKSVAELFARRHKSLQICDLDHCKFAKLSKPVFLLFRFFFPQGILKNSDLFSIFSVMIISYIVSTSRPCPKRFLRLLFLLALSMSMHHARPRISPLSPRHRRFCWIFWILLILHCFL